MFWGNSKWRQIKQNAISLDRPLSAIYREACFIANVTIPRAGRPPTISASLNQTTHGHWFIQWFPTRGITHFFTATQNTTERVKVKNKRRNTGLGQLQALEGLSLCDTFVQLSVHLQAITGVYFSQNFLKATRNTDSSLDYPTSIFSLPPSADCVLLCTAIWSRLFSSALLCLLTLSVFSGTFLHSSTSGIVGALVLWLFVGVSR